MRRRRRRRRLLRHAFTLCSAISLVLCVAVCVLWVRSYGVADGLEVTAHVRSTRKPPPRESYRPYEYRAACFKGILYMQLPRGRAVPETEVGEVEWEYHTYDPPREMSSLRLLWLFVFRRTSGISMAVALPLWVFVVLAGALPLLWLRHHRRARRQRRQGLCPTCGYDLRAHKPGERCPECGSAVEGAA